MQLRNNQAAILIFNNSTYKISMVDMLLSLLYNDFLCGAVTHLDDDNSSLKLVYAMPA